MRYRSIPYFLTSISPESLSPIPEGIERTALVGLTASAEGSDTRLELTGCH